MVTAPTQSRTAGATVGSIEPTEADVWAFAEKLVRSDPDAQAEARRSGGTLSPERMEAWTRGKLGRARNLLVMVRRGEAIGARLGASRAAIELGLTPLSAQAAIYDVGDARIEKEIRSAMFQLEEPAR